MFRVFQRDTFAQDSLPTNGRCRLSCQTLNPTLLRTLFLRQDAKRTGESCCDIGNDTIACDKKFKAYGFVQINTA